MVCTIFGQLVVGPPGSGKSTYCQYVSENLRRSGRDVKIVNLDPANDCLKYKPDIDIMDFISVERVMEEGKCGPNGAMIHCIETLNDNYGWLYDQLVMLIEGAIKQQQQQDESAGKSEPSSADTSHGQGVDELRKKPYLIFDCPGQSEIFTHHKAMRDIIRKLTANKGKHFDLRLVCMNLCDAYYARDPGNYIAILLFALSTMKNLELPHVNVLSKVDLINSYGRTRFNLDYYSEVMDLNYLLDDMNTPFFKQYSELTRAVAGVIEDSSIVSFLPLNIQKPEDLLRVLQQADTACGYYFDDLDLAIFQMGQQFAEMASGRRMEPLQDATVQI